MKKHLIVLLASIAVAACGNDTPPQSQYVQQPAPQYQQPVQQYAPAPVVQQHDTGIGTGTALVGAAAVGTAAYMLGKSNAEKAAQQPQNTYRPTTTISQPAAPRPAVVAPVAAPKPAAPATAPAQVFKPQAAKTMATVTPPRTSSFSVSKRR